MTLSAEANGDPVAESWGDDADDLSDEMHCEKKLHQNMALQLKAQQQQELVGNSCKDDHDGMDPADSQVQPAVHCEKRLHGDMEEQLAESSSSSSPRLPMKRLKEQGEDK